MPCECLVRPKKKQTRYEMIACGKPAKYYRVSGQISTIEMWLCATHAWVFENERHFAMEVIAPPVPETNQESASDGG